MATVADLTDVTRRLNRPLDQEEQTLAATLVDDTELIILEQCRRVQGINREDLSTCGLNEEIVGMVVGGAVARVLKNPDGYRSEGTGPFTYTYDTRAASGFLMLTKEDWRLLGVPNPNGGGGTSIAPKIGHASVVTDPQDVGFYPFNNDSFGREWVY